MILEYLCGEEYSSNMNTSKLRNQTYQFESISFNVNVYVRKILTIESQALRMISRYDYR